jgi:hypothetical protein
LLARFWRPSPRGSTRDLRSTDARARFWAEVREGEREAEHATRSEQSIGAERLGTPRHDKEKACCKSVAPTTITDVRS